MRSWPCSSRTKCFIRFIVATLVLSLEINALCVVSRRARALPRTLPGQPVADLLVSPCGFADPHRARPPGRVGPDFVVVGLVPNFSEQPQSLQKARRRNNLLVSCAPVIARHLLLSCDRR